MIYGVGEPVDRLRPVYADPPATDRYGNEVPERWEETRLSGMIVTPRQEEGDVDRSNRSAIVSGLTLYAPVDVDLHPRDRVRARGEEWVIDGDIARWRNPYAPAVSTATIQLRRVEG